MNAPHIWVPSCKILEPKNEIVAPMSQFAAFFKLEGVKADGRRRVIADWFPNLITDVGLDFLGANAGYLTACRVGTGSGTPSVSDTTLGNQIAATTTVQSTVHAAQASEPYYGSITRTYRFGQGVAAGNLTEVGVASAATSGALWSRALILDGEGNPTTVTVQSDEFLDVTYQLRNYPPLSDVNDEVTIASVTYDTVTRASRVNTGMWSNSDAGLSANSSTFNSGLLHAGPLNGITTNPDGAPFADTSRASASYGGGNLYRDTTHTWGLDHGNVPGGVGVFRFALGRANASNRALGEMKLSFDPVLPKDNTKVLTLTIRHSWARKTL